MSFPIASAIIMNDTNQAFVACFLGAGLICIDIAVRKIPGKRNFRIENSNGFLSASLSLSFGVMVRTNHVLYFEV